MTQALGAEFKPGPTGNSLAEYDGFAVSYAGEQHPIMSLRMFIADSADGETALIVDGDYYILNGDWRMAYSELAPQGVEACIEFFKAKAPQFKSSWSDEPSAAG
jgi:hypothetical protein